MRINEKYLGSKVYQYIEKGRGYKKFKLTRESGKVKLYEVPLSKSVMEKANKINEKSTVIPLYDPLLTWRHTITSKGV